jgi:peptidoglycan/LPS O-acetylase OafA/YrhL
VSVAKPALAHHQAPNVTEERIPELDGVRGLAVLLVMAYHAFAYEMVFEQWTGLARGIVAVTNLGWLGVDLFFVLSGFLITGILLRAKGQPRALAHFYVRRALRILPLYYAVLLVILTVSANSGKFVLLSAAFLANVVTLFGVPLLYAPLWSLAVEEHFYLVWPWLVRAARPAVLATVAAAIVICEPVARAWGFLNGWEVYYFSWFRFDGLAWGALLALAWQVWRNDPSRIWRLALGGGLSAVACLLVAWPFGLLSRQRLVGASLLYSIAQMAFVSLIAAVLAQRGKRWTWLWRWTWLRHCGDWSYCLYLIHLLLFQAWDALVHKLGWSPEMLFGQFGRYGVRALAVFPVAFAIAAFSFRYFESPMLRWRRRLA